MAILIYYPSLKPRRHNFSEVDDSATQSKRSLSLSAIRYMSAAIKMLRSKEMNCGDNLVKAALILNIKFGVAHIVSFSTLLEWQCGRVRCGVSETHDPSIGAKPDKAVFLMEYQWFDSPFILCLSPYLSVCLSVPVCLSACLSPLTYWPINQPQAINIPISGSVYMKNDFKL